MGKILDIGNELAVARFLNESRGKFIRYITSKYSVDEMTAEDVFQDSCIAMWENIQNGNLQNLTSSAFTYLLSIGINKVNKQLGKDHKLVFRDDFSGEGDDSDEIADDDMTSDEQLKQQLVANAVNEMKHSNCKEILWAYYRDRLSMDGIAALLGLNNANTAKARKNQCMGKLKEKLKEMFKVYEVNH